MLSAHHTGEENIDGYPNPERGRETPPRHQWEETIFATHHGPINRRIETPPHMKPQETERVETLIQPSASLKGGGDQKHIWKFTTIVIPNSRSYHTRTTDEIHRRSNREHEPSDSGLWHRNLGQKQGHANQHRETEHIEPHRQGSQRKREESEILTLAKKSGHRDSSAQTKRAFSLFFLK